MIQFGVCVSHRGLPWEYRYMSRDAGTAHAPRRQQQRPPAESLALFALAALAALTSRTYYWGVMTVALPDFGGGQAYTSWPYLNFGAVLVVAIFATIVLRRKQGERVFPKLLAGTAAMALAGHLWYLMWGIFESFGRRQCPPPNRYLRRQLMSIRIRGRRHSIECGVRTLQ